MKLKPTIKAIKVESGIPMPPNGRGSNEGYRLAMDTMKVGDSFVVPAKNVDAIRTYFYRRIDKFKFSARRINDKEFRVWRTE